MSGLRCSSCGAPLHIEDSFCGGCGRPTGAKTTVQPIIAVATPPPPPPEMAFGTLKPPAPGPAPGRSPTVAILIGALAAVAVLAAVVAVVSLRDEPDTTTATRRPTDDSVDDRDSSPTATTSFAAAPAASVVTTAVQSTTTLAPLIVLPATTTPPTIPATTASIALATIPPSEPEAVADPTALEQRVAENAYALGFSNCLHGGATPYFVQIRGGLEDDVVVAYQNFDAGYGQYPPGVSSFVTENRYSGCVSVVPFKLSGCVKPPGDAGNNNPSPAGVAAALADDRIVDDDELMCPDGTTPSSRAAVFSLWIGPYFTPAEGCAARDDILARRDQLGLPDADRSSVYVKAVFNEVRDHYVAAPGYSGYTNEAC